MIEQPQPQELDLMNMSTEDIKELATKLSLFFNAIDGKPIEPDDIIRQLINLKDLQERSRFPSYPLLARNVYLRLIHKIYGDVAVSCKEWADFEAKGLIAYKGEGRKEAVEMTKAPQPLADNQTISYMQPQPAQQEKRGRFFNRGNKQKSEFASD